MHSYGNTTCSILPTVTHDSSTAIFLYQFGLRCFKREPDTTDLVPYCDGGELDSPGKNYCTKRGVGGDYLWLSKVADNLDEGVTNRDDGTSVLDYPLKMCEGDCDSDDHCKVRRLYRSNSFFHSLWQNMRVCSRDTEQRE